jgi:hypothetical protein
MRAPKETVENARRLRRNLSPPEARLWSRLRARAEGPRRRLVRAIPSASCAGLSRASRMGLARPTAAASARAPGQSPGVTVERRKEPRRRPVSRPTAPSISWKHDLPKSGHCQWSATAGGGARNARH